MSKHIEIFNAKNQGLREKRKRTPIVFGSLVLFLYINIGHSTCTSSSGTIGICIDDNKDISSELGITWNGLYGQKNVYQPYKGGDPIQELTFNFNGSKTTSEKSGSNLFAKIPSTSKNLRINGNGRGIQMNDGSGTLKFLLENNANKQIFLDLGLQQGEQEAFKGNLTIDGSGSNQFTGHFYGRGISGNITLGAFGKHSLIFGEKGGVTGKIILQAGTTIITPTPSVTNHFYLGQGIYSDQGSGTLTFKYLNIELFGHLDSTGLLNGNSAIVSRGGSITLEFDQSQQNITIRDMISVLGQSTSKVALKTSGEDTNLTLNGIISESNTNGVAIIMEGKSSTLILSNQSKGNSQENIKRFNFQGSGSIETTFKGPGSQVEGEVSFDGSGRNSILFQEEGSIFGNILINSTAQDSRGENQIIFEKEGEIKGDVYSWSGKNTITFEDQGSSSVLGITGKVSAENVGKHAKAENNIILQSGGVQIGGIEVRGNGNAINTIQTSGNLTLNTITTGDSAGYALYAKNPNGSNVIQVKQGALSINGDIYSAEGKNQIKSATGTSTIIGEGTSIAILAEGGQNILSLDGEENNLRLTTIQAQNGSNYLGKDLASHSKTSVFEENQNLNSQNLFTGTMQIFKGVSAENGKNTIFFATDESQNTAIISHTDESQGTLILKNAISGNNSIFLDISKSSLTAIKEAMQSYQSSSRSKQDQKKLGESAAIFGNITSNNGENTLFITGDEAGVDMQSALFGNVITNGGCNDIILNNSIITPSQIILEDGSVLNIGSSLSGNFTTINGQTTINTSVTLSLEETLVYNLYAQGGTTNLFFDGPINVEIDVKTNKNAKVSLSFASSTIVSQDQNLSSSIDKNTQNNREGFQVDLMGMQTNPPQAKIRSTYQENLHSLTLGGTTIGNIFSFAPKENFHSPALEDTTIENIPSSTPQNQSTQQSKQQSIIFGEKAIFIGNIEVQSSTKVQMQKGSKIFLQDFDTSNPKNNFSLPILTINANSSSQNLPETTISVASAPNSNEKFNLLTIGNTNGSGKSSPKKDTGLQGEGGASFFVRVYSQANQSISTLGEKKAENGSGEKGYVYSDRIIIANIGDNTTAQSETYFIGFILDNEDQIENIKYDTSKDGTGNGGTKQEGNIAVLTVVNTDDKKPGIDLKPQNTQDGFSTISTTLTALPTDINGVYDQAGKYTTYFLSSATAKGVTTEAMDTSSTALSVNYDLYVATFNSLNKRMGELRDNPHSQGVWSRVFGGTQSNHFGLGTKTKYLAIQVGYDYAFGFEGANNYLGISLAYGLSSSKVQSSSPQDSLELSQLKSSLVEVGIYNAYVQDEGWYNDSILKFSYITSNFNLSKQDTAYSTHNFAVIVGDEFGYRFKLGENKEWYIDPQLEMTLGYFNKTQLTQVLKKSWLDSLAEGLLTLRTRVGSSFAYDFKSFTHHKPFNASIYVGLFYEYDYVTDGKIFFKTNLGGESVSSNVIGSSGRVVTNVGSNIFIKDHTRVYFDIQNSFAGKITTDYQVSLGVRYSFGENTGYTPMNTTKMPLKIETSTSTEEKALQE